MQFDDIVAALPQLTADERDAIAARCAALKALGGSSPSPRRGNQGQRYVELLFTAFSDELLQITEVQPPPFIAFGKSRFANKFSKGAETALASSTAWFPKINAAERVVVTRWFAHLVLAHLQDKNWDLGWPNISQALLSLPQIFDHAYPGYIKTGFIHVLIEARVKGTNRHVG